MKPSGLSNKLVFILPVFCVLASSGIVIQQTLRRNNLQSRVNSYEKEREALDKRYRQLCKATGTPLPADEHHHDGD